MLGTGVAWFILLGFASAMRRSELAALTLAGRKAFDAATGRLRKKNGAKLLLFWARVKLP